MFKTRIAEGVKLLNQERPGWLEKIDLGELDMGNPLCCIIGQVDGDYETSELVESNKASAAWGFTLFGETRSNWGTLTEEWKQKILALRSQKEGAK